MSKSGLNGLTDLQTTCYTLVHVIFLGNRQPYPLALQVCASTRANDSLPRRKCFNRHSGSITTGTSMYRQVISYVQCTVALN